MKKIISICAFLFPLLGNAQERQEKIVKDINIPVNTVSTLWVDNINGSVKIEGYDGEAIKFEINRSMKSQDQKELDEDWNKLKLVFEQHHDTVEVYVDGLCDCPCHSHRNHYGSDCDFNSDFSYDLSIQVPLKTNLRISTVNKGDITIDKVSGSFKIENVNGGISMDKVDGPTDVHTINGDVLIRYTHNPADRSRYYTLNGKLTVCFQPDLSADMSFKSFNGEFYTDFDYSMQPAFGLVSTGSEGKGTTYKVDDRTAARVGRGGVNLAFETFNGNIFIRKNK